MEIRNHHHRATFVTCHLLRLKIKQASIKLIVIAIPVTFFAMLLLVGPDALNGVGDKLLATAKLNDGTRLFLVTHYDGHPLDGHDVYFYQKSPTGNYSLGFVGRNEDYWWRASLRVTGNSKFIQ